MMRGALCSALLLSAACSVDDISLLGRPCPCAGGLTCRNGVCVEPGSGGSGNASGAGGSDSGSGGSGNSAGSGGTPCTPLVVPSNFAVDWSLPNSIRWRWDPAGGQALFSGYELELAENDGDLAAKTGSYRNYAKTENPELGYYVLPDGNDPTNDLVRASTTVGLTPGTTYHGRLIARDNKGCAWVSAIVVTDTTDAPGQFNDVVLFADSVVAPATTYPPSFVVSTEKPFAGSHSLLFVEPNPCTNADCYENLKVESVSPPAPGNSLTQNDFLSRAYFEVAVSIEGTTAYWGQFWVFGKDSSVWFLIQPYTIVGGGTYRLYQMPLRVLTKNGSNGTVKMAFADFQAGVSGFNVGGKLAPSARVHVDEAHVRW